MGGFPHSSSSSPLQSCSSITIVIHTTPLYTKLFLAGFSFFSSA